jgi:hypothetical protein
MGWSIDCVRVWERFPLRARGRAHRLLLVRARHARASGSGRGHALREGRCFFPGHPVTPFLSFGHERTRRARSRPRGSGRAGLTWPSSWRCGRE